MITEYEHTKIHQWLKAKYGTPKLCENILCPKTTNRFEWCLKAKKEYEKKRDNFLRMCASCHKRYDAKHKNYGKIINKLNRIRAYPSDGRKIRIMAKKRGGKTLPADIINELLK